MKEHYESIVSKVKCNVFGHEFHFHVKQYKKSFYLQIDFMALDQDDPLTYTLQECRKWILQSVMTESEIIRTCYKAAEAAVLHELDEAFKYEGISIFNPHRDVKALITINDQIDVR